MRLGPRPLFGEGAVEMTAGAGINRAIRPFGRRAALLHLAHAGTGTETAVKHIHGLQSLHRGSIIVPAVGLENHRPVPEQPEPAQVSEDRVDKFGAAAPLVDIFDSKQETATALASEIMRHHRGIGVTQMQQSVGAGSETHHNISI